MRFKSLFLTLLFSVIPVVSAVSAEAQDDTVWTKQLSPGNVLNAVFSPDDSKILVSGSEWFWELDATNGAIIKQIPPFGGISRLTSDKQLGISIDGLHLIDLNAYSVVKDLSVNIKNSVAPQCWSCDANQIVFGYVIHNLYPVPDTIYFVDGNTSKIIKTISLDDGNQGKSEAYYRIAISPDGKYFATSSGYIGDPQTQNDDKTIVRLCSMDNYQVIKVIREEYSADIPWDIGFSPDGTMLAVNDISKINIYSMPNGNLINSVALNPQSGIRSFTFTNDSKFLYCGGGWSKINKWDLKTFESVKNFEPLWTYLTISLSNSGTKFVTTPYVNLYNDNTTTVKSPSITTEIIYPNPVKDVINIKTADVIIKNAVVYNIAGKIILPAVPYTTGNGTITYNVKGLQAGTYLLTYSTLSATKLVKFIKA